MIFRKRTTRVSKRYCPPLDIKLAREEISGGEFAKKKSDVPKDYEKEFLRIFKRITYRHSKWEAWSDYIVMLACALSNVREKYHYEERENRYLKIIRKYGKEEQQLFPILTSITISALDQNPEQDFLGKLFMNLDLGSNAKGQFFTPYDLCQLMAEIAAENVVEKVERCGYITMHDPCCGGGATLIAGINEIDRQLRKVNLNFQNHVLVAAQDIDETAALMCYIQLSLLGIAAYIKVGDTFTDPISENDSVENYWFTPLYFSDIWTMRRALRELDKLIGEGEHLK